MLSIYILICNLNYIWGRYLWVSCVVSSRLLTAFLSVPWFTLTFAPFIMLELHYMLALSKDSTTFWNHTSFPFLKIEPIGFWSWIWILFFSKAWLAMHGSYMVNYALVFNYASSYPHKKTCTLYKWFFFVPVISFMTSKKKLMTYSLLFPALKSQRKLAITYVVAFQIWFNF